MKAASYYKEEFKMSYHAPKMEQQIEKPNAPLINMKEFGQAMKNERTKQGYLSTFLSQKKSGVKQNGFLSGALGNSNI